MLRGGRGSRVGGERPATAAASAERVGGLDDLVDDADRDGLLDAARDARVLLGQLVLDLGARASSGTSASFAAVQDPHGGDRTRHRDLRAQPNSFVVAFPASARVHGDVGAAERLAVTTVTRGQHGRLGEGVQQLRAAAHDAVPLLAHAGR